MPSSLADRFREAHRNRFVGRDEQLAQFEEALDTDPPPFSVLFVHGPGGVGKSALLQELTYRCEERDRPVYAIDAERIEPTPAALQAALADCSLSIEEKDGGDRSGETARPERAVITIDTFEAISGLAPWIRNRFLPDLPASWIVVIAGRQPPPEAWRSDLGLQNVLEVWPLRNLPESAARAYLKREDVSEARIGEILRFTRGHPLALSLAADTVQQQPDTSFAPDEEPDLIDALVRRFLSDVTDPDRRRTVQAASLVRCVTLPLLGEMLDVERASAERLFEWLHTLSFVRARPDGLHLHPIVRTAVLSDLRWRNRDRFNTLQQRAKTVYLSDLAPRADDGHRDTRSRLIDTLYLYRRNPVVQPFFQRLRADWNASPPLVRTKARADDRAALAEMVQRHEGEAAVGHFQYWWEHPAADAQVIRDDGGSPVGFVLLVELSEIDPAEIDRDPAVAAAWNHLQNEAPLREGERAAFFRFWMAADEYQDISPVQSLISAYRVRYYLTAPNLAYTIVPAADPDRWRTLFAYGGLRYLEDATVEVGGESYGLFGHDWRAVPPSDWLARLAERSLSPLMPDLRDERGPRLVVLSRSDFDAAVKEALKQFVRPEALRDHPLLRSRIVARRSGLDAAEADRIHALRDAITEAADGLRADPKTADHYQAVRATYLDPHPTQEAAAESLDLPFSTYRRYLRKGIGEITDLLWREEVGEAAARSDAEM
jgi:hypothetical protein